VRDLQVLARDAPVVDDQIACGEATDAQRRVSAAGDCPVVRGSAGRNQDQARTRLGVLGGDAEDRLVLGEVVVAAHHPRQTI
jgi:hypothetical protein